jgi:hypothetical protein
LDFEFLVIPFLMSGPEIYSDLAPNRDVDEAARVTDPEAGTEAVPEPKLNG